MSEVETAYLNQAGRPRLRHSIVAFLDILGFSHASIESDKLNESQQMLDKIVGAMDDSRQFVRQLLAEDGTVNSREWAIKFFSDNLAVGCPINEQLVSPVLTAGFLIRCAQRYQLRMTLNGFFLRGALTSGSICLTDDIIFGSALIECYQLESKASIVPRVILAEPLRQLLFETVDNNELAMRDAFCRDVDGWWFVNYLEAARNAQGIHWNFIEQHKQSILESLSRTTRHDVLPKFGWACRYHNVFCHWHRNDPGYSDNFRIDRADEQSLIYRLSDAESLLN